MTIGLATDGVIGGGTVYIFGSSDTTRPVITIVSPPIGTVIGSGTEITFRYADETGLRRPMPMIRFTQANGKPRYELIHDGEEFTQDYIGTKTVVQVSPPIWEYKVSRKGGWSAPITYEGGSPTLVPFGTDVGGNEPA